MAKLLIVALVILLPLVYLNSTLDPTQPLRFLLLAITLAVLSAVLLTRAVRGGLQGGYKTPRLMILPIFALYILISAISVVQAINLADAIYDLTKIALTGILLFTATLTLRTDVSARSALVKSMLVSGCLLSTVGVCQYYGIGFTSIPGNVIPYGTMANKNLLACILCLSLPFGLYAALRLSRWWAIAGSVAVAMSVLVVLVGQTRASWVSLSVATVLIIPAYLLCRRRRMPRSLDSRPRPLVRIAVLAGTIALIVIGTASGILLREGQAGIGQRLSSIVIHQDTSSKTRLALWDRSLQLFQQHPLSGVGVGNWKIAFPVFGTSGTTGETGEVYFQQPHNDYLWVLTETGVFGLAAFLIVLALIFAYGYRAVRRSDSDDDVVFVLLMLFGVICFAVDAFFSYPRERVELLLYSTLTWSAIVSIYHRTLPDVKKSSRMPVSAILVACLLLATAAAVIGVIRLNGETHTRTAWIAKGNGNWPEVVRQIDLARSPLLTLDPTSTPLAWYRGVARYSLKDNDAACQDFALAYTENPHHPHVLNNLGTCSELHGDHAQARDYYAQAVEIAPKFDDAWLNLTAVYYNLGQYDAADTSLSRVSTSCSDSRLLIFRQRVAEKLAGKPTTGN